MAPSKKPIDTASRQERKAKKRKLEDAVPDLPGDNDNDNDEEAGGVPITQDEERVSKKARKEEKKSKKKSSSKDEESNVDAQQGGADATAATDGKVNILGEVEAPRKSKKERKAERKAAEKAAGGAVKANLDADTSTTAQVTGDSSSKIVGQAASNGEKASARVDADGKPVKKNNNRNRDKKRAEKAAQKAASGGDARDAKFIIFVGNLPFTATTESITKHFASVKPKSIRHLTKKEDPTKSRGCAFVEFDGYDHMKTALRLFHHSNFEDGLSPARKINVELTAGGGGNTQDRRKKIEQKNSKLNDERLRKIQEDEKAKWAKKREGGAADESGVHPSRRARIPGQ